MCAKNVRWCGRGADRRVQRAQTREQGLPSEQADIEKSLESVPILGVREGVERLGQLPKFNQFLDMHTSLYLLVPARLPACLFQLALCKNDINANIGLALGPMLLCHLERGGSIRV